MTVALSWDTKIPNTWLSTSVQNAWDKSEEYGGEVS